MTRHLRVLRAVAAAGAVVLGLCAAATRVRGRSDELLQSAGDAMFAYVAGARSDEPRRIALNGAELHVLSGSTRDDLPALLAVFEARCTRASGGGLARPPQARERALLQRLASAGDARLDGVLRHADDARGYVACLDFGGETLRATDLIARLRAFAASGDVSALGALRFVWARREGARTAYVALWSEGPLPLSTMFPERGDAPGSDPVQVPRPLDSRRVLSAWQAERAPLLVSYQSDAAPLVVAAAYRRQLLASGFDVQQAHIAPPPRSAGAVRSTDTAGVQAWLVRRGATLALALIEPGEDSGSRVTLSPLHGDSDGDAP